MKIRWYYTGGKRFYVIDVSGYKIMPQAGIGTTSWKNMPTTYAVLDAHDMHREVAVFRPGDGHRTVVCKERAYALAKELNAEEKTIERRTT